MNIVHRILKNTGVLLGAQVVGHALSFFYMMYTARYLGAAGFGILAFALAFTGIFGVISDFGLQQLTIREVARDRSLSAKYLANTGGMKIILATVAFGLIALTINLLGYPQQTINVVYLFGVSIVVNAFNTMFYSIFQAHERMEYQSIGQVLNSALMFCGVIIAMRFGFTVIGFATLYLMASMIVFVYCLVIFRIKFANHFYAWYQKKIELDWHFWRSTVKHALPFGLAMTFVMIFCWVDSVMLSLIKGDAVVGWYNAAYSMVFFLLLIPNSVIAAIFPIMSKFYNNSHDSLRLSFEKSFKYLAIIGIPIGVGTILFAKRFILLIFGVEYMNSIIALQILAWFSVFVFMSVPYGNLFNCLNRQSIVTKITGICVVLNVTLNLILIPKYSLIGACIATVFTQFMSLVLSFIWSFIIGYNFPLKKMTSILARVIISSLLMGIFIMIFYNTALLVLVPLSALFYALSLYVIKGINNSDINIVRSIFKPAGD
jgi:O-antigen/teichoic acid export membrane protein